MCEVFFSEWEKIFILLWGIGIMNARMAKKAKVVLLFSAIIAVPISKWALTFNFDALTPGRNINGLDLGGLTITSPDGTAHVTSSAEHMGIGYTSALNAITNNSLLKNDPLIFTFDFLVSSITLTGGDRGGDKDKFTVTAFNAFGDQLGSLQTPVFGGNPVTPGDPLDQPTMADFFTVTLRFPIY